MTSPALSRRDLLTGISLAGATLALGATSRLAAADDRAPSRTPAPAPTTTTTTTRTPAEGDEIVQLSAALDRLDPAKYTVVHGPPPAALAAGSGIICQPAGSTKYYVDTRKAGQAMTIYEE